MILLATEQLLTCDVDGTLLCWNQAGPEMCQFKDPYDGALKTVAVHSAHKKILLDRLARGATIIVWSNSGYLWAQAALQALNIEHERIIVASKPVGHIDDTHASEWMGPQIFLPFDSKYGVGK